MDEQKIADDEKKSRAKRKQATKPKDTATSRWLSYRPEIKVLDCTIRDGGLMNNHHFDDKIVKAVYTACVAGGIDYLAFRTDPDHVLPTNYVHPAAK